MKNKIKNDTLVRYVLGKKTVVWKTYLLSFDF
jgi:hypothetical protein